MPCMRSIPPTSNANLMALLMRRELDKEGHFQIRWGEQMIA